MCRNLIRERRLNDWILSSSQLMRVMMHLWVLKQSAFVSLVTMSQCQETRQENDADICNIVMHHLNRPLGMFLIECSFCYTVRNTKRSCDDSLLEISKLLMILLLSTLHSLCGLSWPIRYLGFSRARDPSFDNITPELGALCFCCRGWRRWTWRFFPGCFRDFGGCCSWQAWGSIVC